MCAGDGPCVGGAVGEGGVMSRRVRAAVIRVGITVNGGRTLGYAAEGVLVKVWPGLAALAPVVLAGIVLGEILHHRVDEQRFRQVLFSVLLLAGLALVF